MIEKTRGDGMHRTLTSKEKLKNAGLLGVALLVFLALGCISEMGDPYTASGDPANFRFDFNSGEMKISNLEIYDQVGLKTDVSTVDDPGIIKTFAIENKQWNTTIWIDGRQIPLGLTETIRFQLTPKNDQLISFTNERQSNYQITFKADLEDKEYELKYYKPKDAE